jgi:hypothetical protein
MALYKAAAVWSGSESEGQNIALGGTCRGSPRWAQASRLTYIAIVSS